MNNIEHNIAKRGRIWTYLYSQHCTHRVNSVFEEREYKIQFINARENNIFWQGSILLHLSNIESSTKVAKEEGWGRYWIWRRRDRISASLLVFFRVGAHVWKSFAFRIFLIKARSNFWSDIFLHFSQCKWQMALKFWGCRKFIANATESYLAFCWWGQWQFKLRNMANVFLSLEIGILTVPGIDCIAKFQLFSFWESKEIVEFWVI